VWIKGRSYSDHHAMFDSSRGVGKVLSPSQTNAETDNNTTLDEFRSDGFGIGTDNTELINKGTNTYVSFNWKANGGTTSSNSDGSITSTVQANTTAGFSIVLYTGTGSATTVGHGLGVVPKWIVIKNRDAGRNWIVYHGANTSAPETEFLILNTTATTSDNSVMFNDTAPTSSVFTVNTNDGVNTDGEKYVAYCFAEVEGYSKYGKFSGNGSTDGTFCFTNFAVKWLMVKRTDTSDNWAIYDSTRDTFNVRDSYLYADSSQAETTYSTAIVDFLSNGFKWRGAVNFGNASGGTYIYMAFAEAPFKYALAR
jgi:hypothetical protein